MTQRNIHGDWSMSFENRILLSKADGSFNQEANKAWLSEMKELVLSSPEGDSTPWVVLLDFQNWDIATLDSWESANEGAIWVMEHSGVSITFVFSKKLQQFAAEKGLIDQSIVKFLFNYDEAYQACLDKLAEARRQQN